MMKEILAILGVVAAIILGLAGKCSKPSPAPEFTPNPSPEPSPSATPVPDPVFIVPQYVPVGTPFAVSLCDGLFLPSRVVSIDGKSLGTLGWNSMSGCSMLIIPSLSGSGLRTISADKYSSIVKVLPKK